MRNGATSIRVPERAGDHKAITGEPGPGRLRIAGVLSQIAVPIAPQRRENATAAPGTWLAAAVIGDADRRYGGNDMTMHDAALIGAGAFLLLLGVCCDAGCGGDVSIFDSATQAQPRRLAARSLVHGATERRLSTRYPRSGDN